MRNLILALKSHIIKWIFTKLTCSVEKLPVRRTDAHWCSIKLAKWSSRE